MIQTLSAVVMLSVAATATAQPTAQLHVVDEDSPEVLVERTGTFAAANLFRLKNNGVTNFEMDNNGNRWSFGNTGNFRVNAVGTGAPEMQLTRSGNMTVRNTVTANGFIDNSSRTLKTGFESVDEEAVLEKLVAMPVTTWRYKDGADQPLHMGPVAEDFQAAFGLSDGKGISSIDANGVTMAAVKGLHRKLERRDQEIEALRSQNEQLASRLASLEAKLSTAKD